MSYVLHAENTIQIAFPSRSRSYQQVAVVTVSGSVTTTPIDEYMHHTGGRLQASGFFPENFVSSSQILEGLFAFRDRERVLQFLNTNPFLVSFLFSAYRRIKQHFPRSPLALQVVVDPEEDYQQLVLLVETHLNPEAALGELDRLNDEWWFESMGRTRGKFGIDLEYR